MLRLLQLEGHCREACLVHVWRSPPEGTPSSRAQQMICRWHSQRGSFGVQWGTGPPDRRKRRLQIKWMSKPTRSNAKRSFCPSRSVLVDVISAAQIANHDVVGVAMPSICEVPNLEQARFGVGTGKLAAQKVEERARGSRFVVVRAPSKWGVRRVQERVSAKRRRASSISDEVVGRRPTHQ